MKGSVSWRSPVAASSSNSPDKSRRRGHHSNSQQQQQQQQQHTSRTATMSGYHHHYDYYHTPQAAVSQHQQQQQQYSQSINNSHNLQQQQQQQTPNYLHRQQQHQQQYQYQLQTPQQTPPVLLLDASNPTPATIIRQASNPCRVGLPRFSSILGGGAGRGSQQSQSQQSQSQQSQQQQHQPQQQHSSRRRGRHEMTNNNKSHNRTLGHPEEDREANSRRLLVHQQQEESYQHYSSTAASSTRSNSKSATTASNNSTTTTNATTTTAAHFARTAPCAGFLHKQGTNIPEMKRRFFVLQPSTHLYYFLSPTDTTPRGCVDLTDAWVQDITTSERREQRADGYLLNLDDGYPPPPLQPQAESSSLPDDDDDGPYRFAICWDPQSHHDGDRNSPHPNQGGDSTDVKRIILEARSRDLARQWMQAIECERLDYVKQQWNESQTQVASQQEQIQALQQELEQMKHVEADRDGAVQDAQTSREEFEALNEAVRQLALQLVRPLPPSSSSSAATKDKEVVAQQQQQQQAPEEKATSTTEKVNGEKASRIITSNNNNDTNNNNNNHDDKDNKSTVAEDEKKDEFDAREQHQKSKAAQPQDRLNSSLLDEAVLVSSEESDQAATDEVWLQQQNDAVVDEFAPREEDVFNHGNSVADDFLNVPGVHFSSLYNACQQLRDNWQLASQEAATAVQDATAHQSQTQALEARMKKAEKHLCQIWEENCALRKSLKQKKREKRVLVKEVRNLQEQQQEQQQVVVRLQQQQQQQQQQENPSMRSVKESGPVNVARGVQQKQQKGEEDDELSSDEEDEERLINELEEHVLSSIRLHEQILVANSSSTMKPKEDASSSSGAVTMGTAMTSCETSQASRPASHVGVDENQTTSSMPNGVGSKSLFDDSDDSDDDDDDESQVVDGVREEETENDDGDDKEDKSVDVSSTCAEASVAEETRPAVMNDNGIVVRVPNSDSPASTPERPNPLLQLDEDSSSADQHQPPNMCAASSQSESSSRSANVTTTGQATSQLACPLADVVDRNGAKSDLSAVSGGCQDLQVYHLTFYSRKIGLQFQKVPPPPAKAKGLLTDALTADLTGVDAGSGKTAAELRRIASICDHGGHGGGNQQEGEPILEVATPVDAVLVCGFHGFDDSGSNVRPKLGARLVAFDGVSVEVGRWTFESIRKSIQARNRPLTLSFRNDFLTTEQRRILTKAVKDVDAAVPPPRPPTLQYRVVQDGASSRPPSATPSMQTATSHESDVFINDAPTTPLTEEDFYEYDRNHSNDNWSVSLSGSSCDHFSTGRPQSFSAARSVSSAYSNSNRQQQHNSFRSFSEAGSSTSVLSAVGPLMAQLLPSAARKEQQPFTPEYLRRGGSSLEDTPQHQDFKSSLL